MRSHRTTTTIAAGALLAALITAMPLTAPAAAKPGKPCAPSWQLVDVPLGPGNSADGLYSVEAVATRDVWISGQFGGLSRELRWDGRRIIEQPRSNPLVHTMLTSVQGIRDMSFHAEGEGWATVPRIDTGLDQTGTGTGASIGARLHDDRVTLTPFDVAADPRTTRVTVESLVSLSADDAWAVGTANGPMIQHWDGTRWRRVDHPALGLGGDLTDIAAVAADDIWAAGRFEDGQGSRPLVMHYDGAGWQIVPSPTVARLSEVVGISASGPDNAWVIGRVLDEQAKWRPFVMGWDGTAWRAAELPAAGELALSDVYAASPTDVWVVSTNTSNRPDLDPTEFLHYDGTSWTAVPVPGPSMVGLRYNYFGIDGTGPDDVWAIGHSEIAGGGLNLRPIVAHLTCAGGRS